MQHDKCSILILLCLLCSFNSSYGQLTSNITIEDDVYNESKQFDAVISYFKKKNDILSLAAVYEKKGDILYKHAKYASIEYYKKSFSLFSECNQTTATLRLTNSLAVTYNYISDYKNALEQYYNLLHIYENNEDTLKIAQTHSTIGSLYNQLKNPTLSFKHYKIALSMSVLLKSKRGMAAISNNIAGLYFDLDSIDIAFDYVRNAERINTEMDNQYWLSINYSQYSDFYRDLGKFDSARYYLDKSNDYTYTSGTALDSIDSFRKTGIYYYYVDSIPKALHFFNKGILLSRKEHRLKSEAILNHWISDLYESRENIDLSLTHLKIYYDLLDSVSKRESTQRIEEHQILFQVRELESDLSESKFAQEIAQQNIEKNHSQLMLMLLVIVILLIIGASLYIQYHRQVKTNKMLLKLNIEGVSSSKKTNPKYSKSNLSDEKKSIILTCFIKEVVDSESFKDQELKLETVANRLNVSRTYLSQVINETYNQNFTSYINHCRITLAKKYLLSAEYEIYSIQGISELVGFKSLSSFNSSFKKITGLTPSYYRKNAKNIN